MLPCRLFPGFDLFPDMRRLVGVDVEGLLGCFGLVAPWWRGCAIATCCFLLATEVRPVDLQIVMKLLRYEESKRDIWPKYDDKG